LFSWVLILTKVERLEQSEQAFDLGLTPRQP